MKDYKTWLYEFQKKKGRPLRVLHVGNIANNAYLNAKLQRKFGIHADVLNNDYKHIMGCPEWEDAEFVDSWGDDFNPDFNKSCKSGFKKPSWFYTGSREQAIKKILNNYKMEQKFFKDKNFLKSDLVLLDKNQDDNYVIIGTTKTSRNFLFLKKLYWYRKEIMIFTLKKFNLYKLFKRYKNLSIELNNRINKLSKKFLIKSNLIIIIIIIKKIILLCKNIFSVIRKLITLPKKISFIKSLIETVSDYYKHKLRYKRQNKDMNLFGLIKSLIGFHEAALLYSQLNEIYDVIQAYAIEPIYFSFMQNKTPLIAFEHGTIRQIPFNFDILGILTARAYKKAQFCFITNADNIVAAKKLKLNSISFIPHPINEDHIQDEDFVKNNKSKLHAKYLCNEIIFHPSRHDWGLDNDQSMMKANDIFFKGFATYLKEINKKSICITTEWGISVDSTKKLIKDLNIEDRVIWTKPLPNIEFIKLLSLTDIVADQFYLGAFGSLTPKALMLGIPVLLYLDKEKHNWALEEMPPVLNTPSSDEVFRALKDLYTNPELRKSISKHSKEWYEKYHSNKRIFDIFYSIYSRYLK